MLVIARTITGGLKSALITIAGIVTADLIFLLLVVYGLQAIAESLGILFTLIKYLGGLYLIWLGISIWISQPPTSMDNKLNHLSNWASGLIITLSNPKAILFYIGFLPAFVDIPTLSNRDILFISLIIGLILGGVMFFYAMSTIRAQNMLNNTSHHRLTKGIASGLMITTGSVLIAKT